MKGKKPCALVLVLSLLAMSGGTAGALPRAPVAEESIAVIRQDCSSYSGPEPCYESLSAWEADYGGLPNGDLVSQDRIAVASGYPHIPYETYALGSGNTYITAGGVASRLPRPRSRDLKATITC